LIVIFLLCVVCGFAAPRQLPTYPGNTLAVPMCGPEETACWATAPSLRTFSPARGIEESSVSATLSLAHHEGSLLVRVSGLPAGALVRASLGIQEKSEEFDTREVHGAGPILALPAMVKTHHRRKLWLQIELEEGGNTLYWAPSEVVPVSTGPLEVWFGGPIISGRTLTVERAHGAAVVYAEGAKHLEMTHQRPAIGRWSLREWPKPWSTQANSEMVSGSPIETGWYRVRAIWGPTRSPTAVEERVFWWEAEPSDAVHALGIHPKPKRLKVQSGKGVRLASLKRICLAEDAWLAVAEQLSEELLRLGQRKLPIETCGPGRGSLWLGKATGATTPDRLPLPETVPKAESFQLSVGAGSANVYAHDVRGALYGGLALVDALVHQRVTPSFTATDWPSFKVRFLFHRFDDFHAAPLDLERYAAFLTRVVARGRYNTLILNPRGAYKYEQHPELAGKHALTKDQLKGLIAVAKGMGMEVWPAANAPSHGDWILPTHSELAENRDGKLLCTRHPETYPLLTDVYDELLEVFEHPGVFHAGHDEIVRRSWSWNEDERCPRCMGTPSWVLYGDDLAWHIDFFAARNVRPIFWTDMFVERWNGRTDRIVRGLNRLTDAQKKQLIWMSWTDIGKSVRTLSAEGYETWWGMTGHKEVRRMGLPAVAETAQGAGLAVFYKAPWTAFGWFSGRRPLDYHWTQVLTAGTTVWNAELAKIPLTALMREAEGLPAFRPGLEEKPVGEGRPIVFEGQRAPEYTVRSAIRKPDLQVATAEEALHAEPGRTFSGLRLEQAMWLEWGAEQRLRYAFRYTPTQDGAEAARVVFTYDDGETATHSMFYGVDTWAPDGDLRITQLWNTTNSTLLGGEGSAGVRLFTLDIANPRPKVKVTRVSIETGRDGVHLLVGSAALLP